MGRVGDVSVTPSSVLDKARVDNEDEFVHAVWIDHPIGGAAEQQQSSGSVARSHVLDRRWLIPGAGDTEEYVAAIERVRRLRELPTGDGAELW